jgi:multidrug transporter EmrE-like cation transporter
VKTFMIAILSVAFSVAAQFSLKAGMSSTVVKAILAEPLSLNSVLAILTNKFVFGGFALYVLGALVWLGVLTVWDVSKAYPLVGVGFVLTVAIGWLIGEQVTLARVLGVALICAGVVLVGRS